MQAAHNRKSQTACAVSQEQKQLTHQGAERRRRRKARKTRKEDTHTIGRRGVATPPQKSRPKGIKASINKTAFPEEAFDVIVANFSLHHVIHSSWLLPENEKAQKELLDLCTSLKACLRKNGTLVLREMSRMNFWRFMPYRWKMGHIDWEIHPTLKEWLLVLKQAGFRDVSYKFLTPYFLSTWPSFVVRNRLANFFFSSTFYLYGTK